MKVYRKLLHVSLMLLLGASAYAAGNIRLPKVFCDCMVLQRDVVLDVWGWADPGTIVTVRFNGGYYESCTDQDGRWGVKLPPQKAGGPYVMEVNEKVIRDVLVGDVWLCSGQSNQETPIHRLTEMFPEINVSDNHHIRHFKVPALDSGENPCEDISGNPSWHSAVASQVMNWTGLAWFYAQEAYKHTGVPQGMIVSSLGGSEIEKWIAPEHMENIPYEVYDYKSSPSAPVEDMGEGRWHVADLDDSQWPAMVMPGSWKENGVDVCGTIWMRKDFEVPADMAGRHAKLSMGTLVHNDRVYVNGVFVGSTGYEYPPRRYHIPAGVLREGKNTIAVRLNAPSGNGEFIKDKPYKIVGDADEIDLRGEWKYRTGSELTPPSAPSGETEKVKRTGSGLYNGMIYPLRDCSFAGVIWYQGESNASRSDTYYDCLKALVSGWRETFDSSDLPFLMVQLPNFMKKNLLPGDSGWARIREAQMKAHMDAENTALAVTYDSGEWNDIHPLDKKTVAQRLFHGARNVVYGENTVVSGPIYKSMKVVDGKVVISFTETGRGLAVKGDKLKHFAIAGSDRVFVWADAVIRGNTVVVSSEYVDEPVAVRYAWSDNPEDANLISKDGIPASPFRTDSW